MANIYGEKSNLKVQWEKIKDASPQEKFDWFVQYFGLYALIIVAFIAGIVIWIVVANQPKKPELLSGILLDVTFDKTHEDLLKDAVAKELNADPLANTIGIMASPFGDADTETQLYQQEVITTRVAAKELDILGAVEPLEGYIDPESIGTSIFFPLDLMISEESLKKLTDADRVVSLSTSEGDLPFFIDAANSRFAELTGITYEHYYLGLLCTAPHPEGIEALIRLILE